MIEHHRHQRDTHCSAVRRGATPRGRDGMLGRRRRRQLRNKIANSRAPLSREYGKAVPHRAVNLDRSVRQRLSIPTEYPRAGPASRIRREVMRQGSTGRRTRRYCPIREASE